MNLLPIAEFAAKRRKTQDDAIDTALPLAQAAVKGEAEEFVEFLHRLYDATYADEGGVLEPKPGQVISWIHKTLDKTDKATNPETLAVIAIVAVTNAATVQAAGEDPEALVMEWITMGDDAVRDEHEAVAGQQRPVGEPFDVDGHQMPYPGYIGAPIELWINCRCTLAPTLASESIAASADIGQTGSEQEDDMAEDETTEEPVLMTAVPWYGVLAPEGQWSGDGRMFAEGSLSNRDLPLPLTWQKASSDGHDGSVTVAKIERTALIDGEFRGIGHFLLTPEADEAVGMIADFGKFGVSVDADDAEFEFDEETAKVTFTKARVSAASIVAIPAFAQAFVALGDAPAGFMPEEVDFPEDQAEQVAANLIPFKRGPGWITNPADTKRLHDYWTKPGEEGYAKIGWGTGGDFNRCRVLVGEKIAENSPEDTRFLNQICAQWHHDALGIWPGEHKAAADAVEFTDASPALSLVASIRGHQAPSDWFEDPQFAKITPFRVEANGRVFGHVAQWGQCHLGWSRTCVTAPLSSNSYAYFKTGEVLTDKNEFIAVGHIVLGGEHAGEELSAQTAMSFYSDTSVVACDVNIGEDAHGIWVAGWVRPGVDDDTVTALRASQVSGDWRRVGNELNLIIALAVNAPGYTQTRVAASVRGGYQMSLVAAGVVHEEPDTQSYDIDKIAEAVAAAIESRNARRERMAALAVKINGGE